MASKYSEAGKGSTTKLKQKKAYDQNYERIWGKKENKLYEDKYYDSDETTSWDEDRIDIIGLNGNTGDHYIKWLFINLNQAFYLKEKLKEEHQIKIKEYMKRLIGLEGQKVGKV